LSNLNAIQFGKNILKYKYVKRIHNKNYDSSPFEEAYGSSQTHCIFLDRE